MTKKLDDLLENVVNVVLFASEADAMRAAAAYFLKNLGCVLP